MIKLDQFRKNKLTSYQKDIWLKQNMNSTEPLCNIGARVEISGIIDWDILNLAINKTIEENDALRIHIIEQDENPSFRFNSRIDYTLPYYDFSESENSEQFARDWTQQRLLELFDLKKELFDFVLIKVKEELYFLFLKAHHIIVDGWGLTLVGQRITENYNQYFQKTEKKSQEDFSFVHLIVADNKYTESSKYSKDIEYWKSEYQKLPEPLFSYKEASSQEYSTSTSDRAKYIIKRRIYNDIIRYSKACNCTEYHYFLSVLALYFCRLYNREEMVIGIPVLNRGKKERGIIGHCVNLIPLRIKVQRSQTFSELMTGVRSELRRCYRHYKLPYGAIYRELGLHRHNVTNSNLYDMILSFDVHDVKLMFHGARAKSYVLSHQHEHQALFALVNSATPKEDVIIYFDYMLQVFDDLFPIQCFISHFDMIIGDTLHNPDQSVKDIEILAPDEKCKLLFEWNDTCVFNDADPCIHQLFEQQREKTPHKIAVVYDNKCLTYQELNEKSNQLAWFLRSKGVISESLTGILMDRSLEMVIGLLGILKAGGVYVPLDVNAPSLRLSSITEDSGIDLLLTQKSLLPTLSQSQIPCLCLDEDWREIEKESNENLCLNLTPNQRAYIIYTSGTTGKPKGVIISHQSAVNTIVDINDRLSIDENDHILGISSICFDLSVYDIFGILAKGATLVIPKQDEVKSPSAWIKYIDQYKIRVWNSVPQLMQMLVDYTEENEKTFDLGHVLMSGDWIPLSLPSRIKKISPSVNTYSLGGATEASIWSIIYHIKEVNPSWKSIPYGKPLSNQKFYVLTSDLTPAPISIPGDIYISGKGVALGYLNRPGLTKEKFIPDPFSGESNEIMYKTGDLGRYLPDGTIEFIGRSDNQVKIRGYRIELGEIESVINMIHTIQDSVVLVKEDLTGSKRLVGYFVAEGADIKGADIKKDISKQLPDYMIPSQFIELASFPLTQNGKVDRSALPEPDASDETKPYVPPENEIEASLCQIWQSVLCIESVGTCDNFFEIGGDSILAIQIISRANRQGIELTARQIYEHQIIAEIALYVTQRAIIQNENVVVTGEQSLLPAQFQFLTEYCGNHHHFNQSMLLTLPENITESKLKNALLTIEKRHDIFRLRFSKEEGDPLGYYLDAETDPSGIIFKVCDVRYLDASSIPFQTKNAANRAQAGLNIHDGPLCRVLLFQTPQGINDQLLWVIHHLIIDGVSWRILMQDLMIALQQEDEGDLLLAPKTTSYQAWGEKLKEYSRSESLEKELYFWLNIISTPPVSLPVDYYGITDHSHENTARITVSLKYDVTQKLLKQANRCYHTQINDLLLSALLESLTSFLDMDTVRIDLEGHGREELFSDVDVSETIGWFTSIYPVLLNRVSHHQMGERIQSVKEQLRQIPHRGLGYGLLRYLTKSEALNHFDSRSAIVFNYLGQLDSSLSKGKNFNTLFDLMGNPIGHQNIRDYRLGINGIVDHGCLQFTFDYNQKEFKSQTIHQLATDYTRELEAVVNHCLTAKGGYTPSDFPLARLNQDQLNELLTRHPACRDCYPSTAMQDGLIFHSEMHPDTGVYMTQLSLTLENVSPGKLIQSWEHLIERHAILRTSFVRLPEGTMLQIVQEKVSLPFNVLDWRSIDHDRQSSQLETLLIKERTTPFNFEEAPLMRCILIQQRQNEYQFIWTHHHAILDGWGISILFNELNEIYHQCVKDQAVSLPPAPHFRNYVSFLDQQDREEAKDFWRDYLSGVKNHVPMPKDRQAELNGADSHRSYEFHLSQSLTGKLQEMSKKCRVTLNTILQGAWGFMLARYSSGTEAVFGCTRSGRAISLRNIESMVGLFLNSVPLCVRIPDKETLIETWLQSLQTSQHLHDQFSYLSLNEIKRLGGIPAGGSLFDTLFVFENYPMDELASMVNSDTLTPDMLKIKSINAFEQINYPLGLTVALGDCLKLRMLYQSQYFLDSTIQRFMRYYREILVNLTSENVRSIGEISMLPMDEKHQIVFDWNQTDKAFPGNPCIHHLFEEQVDKTPNHTAIIYDGCRLSYQELEDRSNQLARYLRKKGVSSERLVGILMDRSLEMILGLFAILKAGGAYVPFDISSPPKRLKHMIEDSNICLLLSLEREHLSFDENTVVCLNMDTESEEIDKESTDRLNIDIHPEHIAYIIYTSGTTGRPKGVIISHQGAVNTLLDINERMDVTERDHILNISSVCFDLSVYDIFGILGRGAMVVIPKKEEIKSPSAWLTYLETYDITMWNSVPQLMQMLVDYAEETGKSFDLKCILMSGDWIPVSLPDRIRAISPQAFVYGMGGATEASIWSILYPVKTVDPSWKSIPYGKPLSNQKFYILGPDLTPCPVSVAGDLYIAGKGVALGYLNRPGLTKEKFIPDPFSRDSDAIMYKTGDLGRYITDGTIEFIGRSDEQIKIRGFRVELGEIEAVISQMEPVQNSVVVARSDQNGNKRLIGYVIFNEGEIESAEIKKVLSEQLPDYMIPSEFIYLDVFPLTDNGKVDRNALPEPDLKDNSLMYVPPRNEIETVLCEIWSTVLGMAAVGIEDNFFEIGGDSILAIQVSSRANHKGISVSVRHLMEYQTIFNLAPHVSTISQNTYNFKTVAGEQILLPVQHWFLNEMPDDAHYFNQSVMFPIPKEVNERFLRDGIAAIEKHHDIFRLRFEFKNGRYNGRYIDLDSDQQLISFDIKDLSQIPDSEISYLIECKANEAQASLDLTNGPLSRLILFKMPEGETDQLLWIMHHLIVDGVSWRILLEDFNVVLQQIKQKEMFDLGGKSISYQIWGEKLYAYSQSEDIKKELPFWHNLLSTEVSPLPVDNKILSDNTFGTTERVTVILDEKVTGQLLKKANGCYHTQINDLLLTALMESLADWMKAEVIRIDLEGHGREDLFRDMDIHKTVGWFTSIYPICLRREASDDIGIQIQSVKEQLRKIPNHGMGYGLLRYCIKDDILNQYPSRSEVVFNYLGQLDSTIEMKADYHITGKNVSDQKVRDHRLGINGGVMDGCLQFTFDYNKMEYETDTIQTLSDLYMEKLNGIVSHCLVEKGGFTPSDFPMVPLNQGQLVTLEKTYPDLSDLYISTPMQKGLLFHTQMDSASGIYMTQMSMSFKNLNAEIFCKSWEILVSRHAIFRTAFIPLLEGEYVQLILKDVVLPWKTFDWRELSSEDRNAQLEILLKKESHTPFNYEQAPLMRCILIQEESDISRFIWTHHHALMDGWCLPILFGELFQIYQSLFEKTPLALPPVVPYRNYISWLNQQDNSEAEEYWRTYLSGFDIPSELPTHLLSKTENPNRHCEFEYHFSEKFTSRIQIFAKRCKVSMNTVLQAAWGVLLSRYSKASDVMFGSTRSGRGISLSGIESIVGLFINTLPLRVHIPGDETSISSFLRSLQDSQKSHDEYGYLSLSEIQGLSELPNGRSLFETIFVFENYPMDQISTRIDQEDSFSEEIQLLESQSIEKINYPIGLAAAVGKTLQLRFLYQSNSFSKSDVKQYMANMVQLLSEMVEDEGRSISEIEMLTKDEKHQIIFEWNQTDKAFPDDLCIHHLFEGQVHKTPNHTAVIYGGRQLSYQELEDRSNQLARHLRKKGVSSERLVGILMDRSLEMIIGLFAILKAGGAYVPFDINSPPRRLKHMIEDSNICLLLSLESEHLSIDETNVPCVYLDRASDAIGKESTDRLNIDIHPDHIAYIIYTSGTTGKPKGVIISHRGAVNTLLDINERMDVTEKDHILNISSVCFDLSVYDIFGILGRGAMVVIPKLEEIKSPLAWLNYLENYQITMWNTVPQLMQMLVDYAEENDRSFDLRCVLMSGDWIPVSLPDRIRAISPQTFVYGMGGATEASIWSIIYPIKTVNPSWKSIPYGKPLSNQKMYVLDSDLTPCPVYVAGDLYISGRGVAKGYLNRPDLTREKFITDVFSDDPDGMMYKTGDLSRYLPDGNIEFIGRCDDQVKVRGFRVELGEIESALNQIDQIRDSVVVARKDQSNTILIAYYLAEEAIVSLIELKEKLSTQLPDYMIPTQFIFLESFPLTDNGKVDRKKLPEPEGLYSLSTEYIPPETETEKLLAVIWENILKKESIGLYDNFFELGGHSLMVTQVASKIRKELNTELDLKALFENPTIYSLSRKILADGKRISALSIPFNDKRNPLPLSFAQERLWFLDQYEKNSSYYNIPGALRIKGALNIVALEQACREIVSRHEILRTRIISENDELQQVLRDDFQWHMDQEDLSQFPLEDAEIKAAEMMEISAIEPFLLNNDNLFRVTLYTLSDEYYVMFFNMHHIVSDAWSLMVFLEELSKLYDAFIKGKPSSLPVLGIQYADYALWQRSFLDHEVISRQINYWEEKLTGAQVLELPTDYLRKEKQSFNGDTFSFHLDSVSLADLKQFSIKNDATLFMTLFSIFQVLLHKYSGQTDICVGTPITNRTRSEVEPLIGFFVNTLVFRSQLDLNGSFISLLEEMRTTALEAFDHQDVPFEKVVDCVQPERNMARSPLFQVMFVMQHISKTVCALKDVDVDYMEVNTQTSKFDLTLFLNENEDGIDASIEYNTDLFRKETIERMARHYKILIDSVLKDSDQALALLEMLAPEEETLVIHEWNDTCVPHPEMKCVHHIFEDMAKDKPHYPALSFGNKTLRYDELNAASNQLAFYLIKKGLQPGMRVGVCFDRSFEMIIGVMGVLKSGCAYVPIDTNYPKDRIAYMLNICPIALMLTQESMIDILPHPSFEVVFYDKELPNIEKEDRSNPKVNVTPKDPLYIIFTSGSTGHPKGIEMPHQALFNLIEWQRMQFEKSSSTRILQYASINFDVSFQEIFSTLSMGKTLVLIEEMVQKDIALLIRTIKEERINRIFIPSIVLNYLAEEAISQDITPDALKEIITAGDILTISSGVVQMFNRIPDCICINQYGPSETHVVSSLILKGDARFWPVYPSIGNPILNCQLYVLNESLKALPVGVPGELYIGGLNLANGYINHSQMTEEKFIQNLFSDDPESRLYRTGDRVRWLYNGTIEFIGRADDQVKIRGFRMELGEIEAVLEGMDGVKSSIIKVKKESEGNKRLVAYLMTNEASLDAAAIRTFLARQLPDYMIPAHFVQMRSFPLTPNGKVDRNALPDPEINMEANIEYIEPVTQTEKQLAEIWEQILNVKNPGILDNFFELGGHSLLATRVISKVRHIFNLELPLKALFENPTLLALGKIIDDSNVSDACTTIPVCSREKDIPLSFAQARLWFLDQYEQNSSYYNIPGVISLNGALDIYALEKTFIEIISRHEALRTNFKTMDEIPCQIIHAETGCRLRIRDLTYLPLADALQKVKRSVEKGAKKAFDLAHDQLLRVILYRVDAMKYRLFINMHHIISDAWSLNILMDEISVIYNAFINKQSSPLPKLGIQYADFSVWQREYLNREKIDEHISYWKDQLTNVPLLDLPTDYVRPHEKTFNGKSYPFAFSEEFSDQLMIFSKAHDVTLFMTLLSAFNILLYKYTAQTDICVGSPIANRTRGEVESLIGFFVNILALRSDLSDDPTCESLLKRVKGVTLSAYDHQDIPFEKIVDVIQPERNVSHSPIFQVMIVLQNTQKLSFSLPNLKIELDELESDVSKFDLTLFFSETDHILSGAVEYNTDLFNESTIKQMVAHYTNLLKSMLQDTTLGISSLNMLDDSEKSAIINEWNNTSVTYPSDQCIHSLFEAQVTKDPFSVAVVDGVTQVSYLELNQRANQLSRYLIAKGVSLDSHVGVFLDRSLDMIAGILGILKAGGSYIPLDTAIPDERLKSIIEDSSLSILLTQKSLLMRIPKTISHIMCLDDENTVTLLRQYSDKDLTHQELGLTSHHLAYVIYTSGSTGKPKGVMVEHKGIVNYAVWAAKQYVQGEKLDFALHSSISFDLTVTSIFVPLITGNAIVVYKDELIEDIIEDNKVGILKLTPAHLEFLKDGNYKNSLMKRFIVGGDNLPSELVRKVSERFNEPINFYNEYGPTETVVGCMIYRYDAANDKSASIPIGAPVDNTQIYILDAFFNPVPTGVIGEIFISGDGVARGYLNRDELTKEKFLSNPFIPGTRMYRTGDLARRHRNGNVEYVGRMDDQVKINGFRIELGEIESVLNQYDIISQNAVIVTEDENGNKHLVAYVVLISEKDIHQTAVDIEDQLNSHLKRFLPAYMLPSAFVVLDRLPLTINGKLDKNALPAPDYRIRKDDYVAPKTKMEKRLAGIWEAFLNVNSVGIHDNFFELGGHSLIATQVVSRIRKEFNVTLKLKSFFENPTIFYLKELMTSVDKNMVHDPIKIQSTDGPLPLSFAQERLWFLDQYEQNSSFYNIPGALSIGGELNIDALDKALNEIVARHDSLRTRFVLINGSPSQKISQMPQGILQKKDFSHEPIDEVNDKVLAAINHEAIIPFNLETDPLFKVILYTIHESEHILFINMHHIISDGWSFSILFDEICVLYDAFIRKVKSPLPDLKIQYSDFAIWQKEYLSGEVLEKQRNYWKEKLENTQILNFPTDYIRPSQQTFNGTTSFFKMDTLDSEAFTSLCKDRDVTLFMGLLSVFKVLLYKYSGQVDICVGSPIANRNFSEITPLIGFFVNTLVLRSDMSGNPTFDAILKQVKETTLEAYDHQDIPFEKVVDVVQPDRNLSHSPFFQVLFVMQNLPNSSFSLDNISFRSIELESSTAKFDLTFFFTEEAGGISGSVEYNTDLFKKKSIDRLICHFNTLIKSVLEDSDRCITELEMLTPMEKQQIIVDWNDTAVTFPSEPCLHELFESQVEKTPIHPAVFHDGGYLTYRELEEKSNQLARYLKKKGILTESLVGILMDRSLEMVIGLFGILKAGGAYVPFDITSPANRLKHMIEDSEILLLLSLEKNQISVDDSFVECLYLDTNWGDIEKESRERLEIETKPENTAYIIYTSGTTGKPKGVVISHQGAVNTIMDINQRLDITEKDRILSVSSICFDLSVYDIFGLLAKGGTVILPKSEEIKSPLAWLNYMQIYEITIWNSVPQLVQLLVDYASENDYTFRLDHILMSGDWLPLSLPDRIRKIVSTAKVYSLGGATEASIWSILYPIEKVDSSWKSIPYGKPLSNQKFYILNSDLMPCPVNVEGNLYISGKGVAKGYLKREVLTKEKFTQDPFSDDPCMMMYQTGDVGRYLSDGTIEFIGRCDDQVKIRGFRVELGEIESVLNKVDGVQDSVVLAKEDHDGNNRLIAYVVSEDSTINSSDIKGYISRDLPDYMVPSQLIGLDIFPLTDNGKVDRKALPEPEEVSDLTKEYIAPKNVTEKQLVDIWKEMLRNDKLGITDNFFEVGGHSMLAVGLISKINHQFSSHLSVGSLFQNPTILEMANVLHGERTLWSPLVPIQKKGSLLPLIGMAGAGGNVICYQMLSKFLGGDQPFYGLQYAGIEEGTTALTSVQAISRENIKALKTVQSKGPYSLIGHSFGGIVAFDMALELQRQGEEIDSLIILDSPVPTFGSEINGYHELPSDDSDWMHHIIQIVEEFLNIDTSISYEDILKLSEQECMELLRDRIQENENLDFHFEYEDLVRMLTVYKIHVEMPYILEDVSYDLPVSIFRSKENDSHDEFLGWDKIISSKPNLTIVPGGHISMLNNPHVEFLAQEILRDMEVRSFKRPAKRVIGG